MKFTVIVPVYNEELRIRSILRTISGHVDEIIVINKSSTDDTVKIISENYQEVKVIDAPYSRRGEDDFKEYCMYARNDWIFICVASEAIPKSFWGLLDKIDYESHDLVMVPREYYCFGYSVQGSPWDVSYFPFFFNRKKIVFTNKMHSHFDIHDEGRRYYISCQRKDMIKHFTHTSLENYIKSTFSYSSYEISRINSGKEYDKLSEWIENIHEGYFKLSSSSGYGAYAHFAAWNIYWSIHILNLIESKTNCDPCNESIQNRKQRVLKLHLGIKRRLFIHSKIYYNRYLNKLSLFRKLRVLILSYLGR